MKVKAIHQFVPSLKLDDAVSNSAILTQRLLQKLGYASHIYVETINLNIAVGQKPYYTLTTSEKEALIIHHSLGNSLEKWFINLKNPKLLLYHNIMLANFFKPNDLNHKALILGRKQLKTYLPYMCNAIGDSKYNTAELIKVGYKNAMTIPLLFTLEEFQNQKSNNIVSANKATNGYLLLHVGRLARHKCIHQLIESYAKLSHLLEQPSNLVLLGKAVDRRYLKELFNLCKKLGISNQVRFLGAVSEEIQKAFYEQANAYLCLSDHEGFCVSLIKAAANGVPIVAFDSTNIKNMLKDSGIILSDKDPEKVAATLSVLNQDKQLRQAVIEGQNAALTKYKEQELLAALDKMIVSIHQNMTVPNEW